MTDEAGDDRRYRCKECGHEWESTSPVPPDRCPNGDCGAKFAGGYVDNLQRLR